MKRTTFIAAMLCLLGAGLSCTHDEPNNSDTGTSQRVEEWQDSTLSGDAVIGEKMIFKVGGGMSVEREESTRATTDTEGNATFEKDDVVTVNVSGTLRTADTKDYLVNDVGGLDYDGVPASQFHWMSRGEKVNIRAWSYVKGGGSSELDKRLSSTPNGVFEIQQDQNQGTDRRFRELLYGSLKDQTFGDVTLKLYHQLARVAITVQRKVTGDPATINEIKIGDGSTPIRIKGTYTQPVDDGVNIGSWSNAVAGDLSAVTITPRTDVANEKYAAVLMPWTYPKDLDFIKVKTTDGAQYVYKLGEATTLAAGNQYNFTISLGNDVTTFEVVYPTGDTWASAGFPITEYKEGEQCGIYAVSNGSVVAGLSNVPATVGADKKTLSIAADKLALCSTGYTYYIYYPYRTNPGTVTPGATNATDFFAGVISNWTTATSQSSPDNLRENDLQVGKVDVRNQTQRATMSHKAGLAVMTLGTKNVPTVQYFNSSNSILSGTTDGTTTSITASGTFSSNVPYVNTTTKKCYAVIRESGRTFTGTGADGWKVSYTTPTITAGSVYDFSAESKRTFIRKGWQYECVGSVETFTAPVTGNYKLEVWGAGAGQNPTGNKGGYAYGSISRSANTKLYICVGGFGSAGPTYAENIGITNYSDAVRAYNGGGGVNASGGVLYSANPGGGATHIATNNRGVLKNYKSYQSEVLLVAGGSGATEWSGTGGTGGGTTGGNGTETTLPNGDRSPYYGTGGTQSGGGASRNGHTGSTTVSMTVADFGQGGIAWDSNNDHGAGGGGGWYGGGGTAYAGAGGGGSGHIGSGFISNSTGMQNGVKTGHGQARITTNFEWSF